MPTLPVIYADSMPLTSRNSRRRHRNRGFE